MTLFLNDFIVTITCDQCTHQFATPVREINTQDQITCVGCGALFDTHDARAQLRAAEESIADFSRTIGRLSRPKR